MQTQIADDSHSHASESVGKEGDGISLVILFSCIRVELGWFLSEVVVLCMIPTSVPSDPKAESSSCESSESGVVILVGTAVVTTVIVGLLNCIGDT